MTGRDMDIDTGLRLFGAAREALKEALVALDTPETHAECELALRALESVAGAAGEIRGMNPRCPEHGQTYPSEGVCPGCLDEPGTFKPGVKFELLPDAAATRRHGHYFKACPYEHVDVYRVLLLFRVTDPCIGHAIKKLLLPGGRGGKDAVQDVSEAIDTLTRFIEMRAEESEPGLAT